MTQLRRLNRISRNEPCFCGSGHKFKRCCGGPTGRSGGVGPRGVTYIDSGEDAVRWVICDDKGTSFFSDKDNRVIVFTDRPTAIAVAHLTEFSDQSANEINVAGVGPTKFEHLREVMPYVEVETIDVAVALIRERIEIKMVELGIKEKE